MSRNAGGAVVIDDVSLSTWEVRGTLTAGAAQTAVMIATVPLVASAVWLAATSEHLERPTATALYRGYMVAAPLLIGLYWWHRRPASRFGPLLVGFGGLLWVYSLQSSNVPLLFDLGVLVGGAARVVHVLPVPRVPQRAVGESRERAC